MPVLWNLSMIYYTRLRICDSGCGTREVEPFMRAIKNAAETSSGLMDTYETGFTFIR